MKTIEEQKKLYSTESKRETREYLWKLLVDQSTRVKNQQFAVHILDLFGCGGFVDFVLDRFQDVYNQAGFVLHEIEKNKSNWPLLEEYADHHSSVKNHHVSVSVLPHYGTLKSFVATTDVEHFDLVWLDLCGHVRKTDIDTIAPLISDDTIFAITSYKKGKGMPHLAKELQDALVTNLMQERFPLMSRKTVKNYKDNMTFYVYMTPRKYLRDTEYYETRNAL